MTEQRTICTVCDTGFYHNYNGIWLCQNCGEPRDRPEPAPVKEPVSQEPRTRKRRSTNG